MWTHRDVQIALACEKEEEAEEQEVDDKAQGTGDGGSGEEVQNTGRLSRRRWRKGGFKVVAITRIFQLIISQQTLKGD